LSLIDLGHGRTGEIPESAHAFLQGRRRLHADLQRRRQVLLRPPFLLEKGIHVARQAGRTFPLHCCWHKGTKIQFFFMNLASKIMLFLQRFSQNVNLKVSKLNT